MHGFDVNRFIRSREATWGALAKLLDRVDATGVEGLSLDEARTLGKLYRGVSSDLIQARTERVDATVVDYLNGLVARAYAHVHATRNRRGVRIVEFLLRGYPRLVRAEWRPIALSTLIFLSGGVFGSLAVEFDPGAHQVVLPGQHQGTSPTDRVAREERSGGLTSGGAAAHFSSFLFTHNIQVTFMVFALGITAGLGTVSLLFLNGVPLGALAMQYHQSGEGLFFWAWILPHGVPELTAIFIAGGAGLILARGVLFPGRRRRRAALKDEARRAALLVMGTMPILVLAGLIEGTISQMHEPVIPYASKLAFALVVSSAVYTYLLFSGRRAGEEGSEETVSRGGGLGEGAPR